MTIEKWQAACRAAGIKTVEGWVWKDYGPWKEAEKAMVYPPIGDPATVLAIQEWLFAYNGDTTVSILENSCRVWSRTNNHGPDTVASTLADAIIECAAAMEKENQ